MPAGRGGVDKEIQREPHDLTENLAQRFLGDEGGMPSARCTRTPLQGRGQQDFNLRRESGGAPTCLTAGVTGRAEEP